VLRAANFDFMVIRLFAILLSALMVFQSFEKVSILIYYQTYQDYIAANLCVNRFNPDSSCNGQCYLMKKLRAAEERNQTPVVPDNQKSEFILVIENMSIPESDTPESTRRPVIKSLHGAETKDSIFHPPTLAI
jgi:hypothetical protein